MSLSLNLSAFPEKDITLAYSKFKEGLYDVSLAAFGWDETFQHDRFMKAYKPDWFYYIEHNSQKVGYLCFQDEKEEMHVHLLIIFKEFQGKGFGKEAMNLVSKIASQNQMNITLSTLKNNTQAVNLYKKLGYTISHQDEYFFEMILKNS